MRAFLFNGLSDHDLLRELATLVSRERSATAAVVACLAEVEERRLYLPAGYPSLHAYCVGELRLSEDAAYKRIRAARVARRYRLFDILSPMAGSTSAAWFVLAPYLTAGNATPSLRRPPGNRRTEIERMLAHSVPEVRDDGDGLRSPPHGQLSPGTVIPRTAEQNECGAKHAASRGVATAAPIAPERYSLQVTIGASTHEKLVCLQELLSHRIPSGDLAEVLDHALGVALSHAQKAKFAATEKPRRPVMRSIGRRTIPAEVRRAVWKRDAGQCTFVSEQGHRCGSRRFLEYDHVEPVARGGQATVEGIRLRCRAHNQFEAERVFGAGFMDEKRKQARRAAEAGSAARAEVDQEHERDLAAGLRNMGFRGDEVRRAVQSCMAETNESLETRMRAALRFLRPKVKVILPVRPEDMEAVAATTSG